MLADSNCWSLLSGALSTAFVCTLFCRRLNSAKVMVTRKTLQGTLETYLQQVNRSLRSLKSIYWVHFYVWCYLSISLIYLPKIPLMKMSFLKRVKLCTKSPKEPSHLTCFSQSVLSISLSIHSYFLLVRLILPRFSFLACLTKFHLFGLCFAYSFVCQQLQTRRVE